MRKKEAESEESAKTISIYVPTQLLELIDKVRGNVKRSTWIVSKLGKYDKIHSKWNLRSD